jgi:hypothetical protein
MGKFLRISFIDLRVVVTLLIWLIGSVEVYAQYYITTDSSMVTGVKLIMSSERDNCESIRVRSKNGVVRTYTPLQLTGYGNAPKVNYVSRTIYLQEFKRDVFLNQRVKGPLTLYSYNSRAVNCFFLETQEGKMIPLFHSDSTDFRALLREHMSSCAAMERKIGLVRFQKSSMTRLVKDFNQCAKRPFPHAKWGPVVGYGLNTLSKPSNYYGAITVYDWSADYSGFVVGVGGDYPISSGDLSIHADILLSSHRVSSTSQELAVTTDLVYNSMAIDFPLMLRYRVPISGWRPFLNAGPLVSLSMETTGTVFTATRDQNNIITTTGGTREKVVSGFLYGFAAGAGLEMDLGRRNSVWVEVRTNSLAGGQDSLQKNQLQFLTGYTF